eukprot:CAMPEP_0182526666 /NCGR_PEP_ID=MMETSP1323-20130603/3363_1 /TAXON_ID=236787 /ORGANISM="Florenciella parvula, Strain RCC1693" /LENGTH=39 /DNA_ID= /DNA_START= /DNA_END= /DNA_ORIENTATION=
MAWTSLSFGIEGMAPSACTHNDAAAAPKRSPSCTVCERE